MPKIVHKIDTWPFGIINTLDQRSLPPGAAKDNKNWISKGDKIELRRGHGILGDSVAGSGKVTGLHVAYKLDGTQTLYRSRGKKVEYLDTSNDTWTEVGVDILGDDADGEDVAFANYEPPAGAQMWFCSPNSGLYKVMVANPETAKDNYLNTKNFKGRISISQNRMFLWFRNSTTDFDKVNIDRSGIYGSHIDAFTSYTTVSSEAYDTGDGSTKTFTHNLTEVTSGDRKTAFAVTVTDTVETFTDDGNGVLVGDQGGTGTINYSTGAVSVTFNTAPITSQAITTDYQHEDATNDGVADFTKSPTRVAGEGFIFRQDEGGGDAQNVLLFDNIHYCLHRSRTWQLAITEDDTNATNLPFRERFGIPNHRAAVSTDEGIYYIDDSNEKDIQFKLLRYARFSDKVRPFTISKDKKFKEQNEGLDLSDYRFDLSAAYEWGDIILFACRHKDSTFNNTVFYYDKQKKSFDRHNYFVSSFATYNGTLVAGDSISNNVFTLYSGFDDDDSLIDNFYDTGLDDLGIPERVKKPKRIVIDGDIGPDQNLDIYLALDNGGYVVIRESGDSATIEGGADYVDAGQAITVGSIVVGSKEVGGGGSDVTAFHYRRELRANVDKAEVIGARFVATGIGYVSINEFIYDDIRIKGPERISKKYRS